MKIIISPAKQMQVDTEMPYGRLPYFLPQTKILLSRLQQMSLEELQKLWQCNAKLAEQNFQRIRDMQLEQQLTPAVLAYVGLQYTHMGPRVLEADAWQYLSDNLRILSGFYGVLRADDGITPYRLEMEAKLAIDGYKNLYVFWGRNLYDYLAAEDDVILNLASVEYSKAIESFVDKQLRFVTCVFGCADGAGGYKVKATEAKMARGSMVRWCAKHNITTPEAVQDFDVYGYRYHPELSDELHYIFVK